MLSPALIRLKTLARALPPGNKRPVLRLGCSGVPSQYQSGGYRVPRAPHPHYDPCPSELVGNPGGH